MEISLVDEAAPVSRRRPFCHPSSVLAAAGDPVFATKVLTIGFIAAVIGTLTPIWTNVSSAACEALALGSVHEVQTGA